MKKLVIILFVFLLINFVYSLEPGKLYINDVFIPFETKAVEEKSETKSTFYIYGNRQRIAKKEYYSDGTEEMFYFYNDHLGSPRAISDSDGNIVWKADYLPFGEVFNEKGNNNVKYNSKELDSDTKLHYYGVRYYPTNIGRFITADKIFGDIINPQSLNKYVYTLNNPLKYVDPTGEQARLSYDIKKQLKKYGINPNELIRKSKFLSSIKGLIRTPISLEERNILISKDALGKAFTPDSSIVRTKIFKEKALLIGTLLHEAAHLSSLLKINEKIMTATQNMIYNSISNLNIITKVDYDKLLGIAEELRTNRLMLEDAERLPKGIITKNDLKEIIKLRENLDVKRYDELNQLLKGIIIKTPSGTRSMTEKEKQSVKEVINQISIQY